jgi:DNA polymerase I-like protein with 3'-5' exonuclease and polymerase domains
MKKALVILDKQASLSNLKYKIVGNIHDEIQTEVKDLDSPAFGKLAVSAIQKAGETFNLNCPLDGDYKIGETWNETH